MFTQGGDSKDRQKITKPVEFEKNKQDYFGMGSFITDNVVKKVKKNAD